MSGQTTAAAAAAAAAAAKTGYHCLICNAATDRMVGTYKLT